MRDVVGLHVIEDKSNLFIKGKLDLNKDTHLFVNGVYRLKPLTLQQLKTLIFRELYKVKKITQDVHLLQPPYLFINEINYLQVLDQKFDFDIVDKMITSQQYAFNSVRYANC